MKTKALLIIARALIETHEHGFTLEYAVRVWGVEEALRRWEECQEAHYPGDCELCAMVP